MTDSMLTGSACAPERARAAFVGKFGKEPTGLWGAPGRANLIGEHTDYNDGFVLPFALDRLTAVAAAPLASDQAGQTRWVVYSETLDQLAEFDQTALAPGTELAVTGWAGYVAGVVWALTEAGFTVPGAQLSISSDVPFGAGLSSSAALECAVLEALADLGGLDIPVRRRPLLAQRAEAGYVGMPCGVLDQSASVLCQADRLLFLDCRSMETRQIPFASTGSDATVLVIDSKAEHGHVDGEYATRRASCERAVQLLGLTALRDLEESDLPTALAKLPDEVLRRRVRHVVTENARVLATVAALEAGDLAAVGPLLTASHRSMRDDYEITCPEVDAAVEAALAAGAMGARMTGGGFGGCVLALVDAQHRDLVAEAVIAAYAAAGYTPPVLFTTPPGAGARRLS